MNEVCSSEWTGGRTEMAETIHSVERIARPGKHSLGMGNS
jgi:hypothetical protein